jgi:hypothetical protein
VAFISENDPKTIFEIYPQEVGRYFPDVKLTSLDIEFANEPITRKLRQRLTWPKGAGDP